MGLGIAKFLNTATHFSKSTYEHDNGASGTESVTGAAARFFAWAGVGNTTGPESDVVRPLPEDSKVLAAVIHIISNTCTMPQELAIRDDGATADSDNIGAGVTGIVVITFPSPPTILQGSLCDTMITVDAADGGTITFKSIQIIYQRVIN